ncbi:MAG: IS4 family transposase [Planctomycetota bacterium]
MALGRGLRERRPASAQELECFFASVFPENLFAAAPSGPNSRERLFTLQRTFWLFLFQALTPKTSLREACHHLRSLLELSGPGEDEVTSGGLSSARGRIPVDLFHQALRHSADKACSRAARLPLLGGRDLRIIDATSLKLEDTPKNQERYPQPSSQAEGCGFPVMKVMALFCLKSGAALNFATAIQTFHDTPLAQQIWPHLKSGDVLLGDRAFGDFVTLAMLPLRGVDVLTRLHQGRKIDFRKALRRFGPGDGLFAWRKPVKRPDWMTPERWREVPDEITVRVVRRRVASRCGRIRDVYIATTLLDPVKYPAAEIVDAYRRRWRIELSFRDLKTTMEMEHLRAKSPEIAMKELLAALIAYNLVRITMIEASRRHHAEVERLSFKGTVDAVRQYSPRMARARSMNGLQRLRAGLFRAVAKDRVPLRPGRREPRAVKRRPKPFPQLTVPRHEYREMPHRNRWKRGMRRTKAVSSTR